MKLTCPNCRAFFAKFAVSEDCSTRFQRTCRSCRGRYVITANPLKPVENGTLFAYRVTIVNPSGWVNLMEKVTRVPRSAKEIAANTDALRTPQCQLVVDLCSKWDTDKAAVLADWCEEHTLFAAAFQLRERGRKATGTVLALRKLMGVLPKR